MIAVKHCRLDVEQQPAFAETQAECEWVSSRADARAVEQVLIEEYGGPGGQLLNKINSISRSNPAYAPSIERGCAILAAAGVAATNVCG